MVLSALMKVSYEILSSSDVLELKRSGFHMIGRFLLLKIVFIMLKIEHVSKFFATTIITVAVDH